MTEFDSYQKGYLDGRHDEMALSAALLLQERKLYEELEERLRDAEALTEFWKMEHKPWGRQDDREKLRRIRRLADETNGYRTGDHDAFADRLRAILDEQIPDKHDRLALASGLREKALRNLGRGQADPPKQVHQVTDQCTCPIGHDHTDNELYEYDPGLHREMHLAWNEEE